MTVDNDRSRLRQRRSSAINKVQRTVYQQRAMVAVGLQRLLCDEKAYNGNVPSLRVA